MPSAHDTYVHCDELENLPEQCKANWLQETRFLQESLPHGASVLQVGCMDGKRILSLLDGRPDLKITGLDIDEELLEVARQNFDRCGVSVPTFLGDISEEEVRESVGSTFDFVICLNNTLGYIEKWRDAIVIMGKLASAAVIVSVYGTQFDDTLARTYFEVMGLAVKKIDGDCFELENFGNVKRFSKEDMCRASKSIETPLGCICTFGST